jgi:tetratricopeptide (TPR) repeat protein
MSFAFSYVPLRTYAGRAVVHAARLSLLVVLLIAMPGFLLAQTDPAALKREASRHVDAGRFGEAIVLLDRYISIRPDEADGYRLRGLCYEERGQMERAVQDFRKAVSLDPGNAQLKLLLTRADKSLHGTAAQQIEGYRRELARNPNAAGPYLAIAEAYRSVESWQDAEKWYEDYFRRTEGTSDELLNYCEVLAKTNDLQKGETILPHYIEKFPQDSRLQSRYGFFLLWLGKYEASQKAFERAINLNPNLAEAHDGLERARSSESNARRTAAAAREAHAQSIPENPVDRLTRVVRGNPHDEENRFALAQTLYKVNRFDEASRQLDTLARGGADSLRVEDMRLAAAMQRESVYRRSILDDMEVLKEDPENKRVMLRLAGYYGELGEYQNALDYMDRYLKGIPDSSATDVRFRYAQYAAWGKYFDRSLSALAPLLKGTPGNLDYQQLRGQIAVWTVRDLDQAVRYLSNVVRLSPGRVQAVLALSSALALEGNLQASKEYLDRARKLEGPSRDVRAAQQLYDDAVKTGRERELYAILENARDLVASGDCQKAVKKYEEYLAKVPDPGKTVMLAYADVQSCAKNHMKAIQIYDQILEQGVDFDVAMLRAKNVLWNGDSLGALMEFRKLSAQKPEDFFANLYLGESYQRLGRYPEARELYQKLLEKSSSHEEQDLVLSRMKFLPITGFSAVLSAFPTRLAFSPPATFYSDNAKFRLASYGGRMEIGLAPMLSIGGSFGRTQLSSLTSIRFYNAYKGQLFVRLSDRFTMAGGLGTLETPGRKGLAIGDANVVYERPGIFRVGGYFERTDAAIMLYSPFLLEIPFAAELFKLQGYYVSPSHLRLEGSFKAIMVSDGNNGSEFQFRIAHLVFEEFYAGYEYTYSDFNHEAPFIPFTNHVNRLYYAPQVLESHCLVVQWQPQKDQEVAFGLTGKVGYLPKYRASVREMDGDLDYRPIGNLVMNGSLSLGSTYRDDSSYNFVSFTISFYWSVL